MNLEQIIKRVMGLSVKNRIRLILQVGAFTIAIYTFVLGHPPAAAQRQPVAVQRVITLDDEKRDIAIDDLQTFEKNQNNWNHDTGIELAAHDSAINRFWGGIVVIGLMIGGSIGITLKSGK